MNSYSTSWWSINRPREDERLSCWPCWLTYSGRFTHINGYPSTAGPVQTIESSPVRDRRSTTEPPKQLFYSAPTSDEFLMCFTFHFSFRVHIMFCLATRKFKLYKLEVNCNFLVDSSQLWRGLRLILFRSTPKNRPNNMGQMSVCPYVRPSVHKNFFRFWWNLVCR